MESREECASNQEDFFAVVFGSRYYDTEDYFYFSREQFEDFLLTEYIKYDWLHYLAGHRHTKMCTAIDKINRCLSEDVEHSNDELYSLLQQHELFERYRHKYTEELDETLQKAFCNFIRHLTDKWERLAASEEDKIWALNQITVMIDNRKYMLDTTQREVKKAEKFLASRKKAHY